MSRIPMKFDLAPGIVGVIYDKENDEVVFVPLSHGVQIFSDYGEDLHALYYTVAGHAYDTVLYPNGRVDAQRAAE